MYITIDELDVISWPKSSYEEKELLIKQCRMTKLERYNLSQAFYLNYFAQYCNNTLDNSEFHSLGHYKDDA